MAQAAAKVASNAGSPSRPWLASARSVFISIWAGLFLVSIAWALSSPLGSAPDEPSHIVRAASVVRGEIFVPTKLGFAAPVVIPAYLSGPEDSPACYMFKPTQPASCVPHGQTKSSGVTTALTSASLYNPLYYALVGWPSLLTNNLSVAVYSMRILTALVASFFLAFVYTSLRKLKLSATVAGLALIGVATPMVFFLSGAVNPNAWEIAGGAALMAGLAVMVRGGHTVRELTPTLVITVVAGVMMVNMRGISPLWFAAIGIIALILAAPGRLKYLFGSWRVRIALAVLIVGALAACVWTLTTGIGAATGDFADKNANPLDIFALMVGTTPSDVGLVGLFGWVDTPAPGFTYAMYGAIFLTIGAWGFTAARGRILLGLVVAALSFLLLPAIVQTATLRATGYIWQGRYTIVALAVALIVCAIAIGTARTTTGEPGASLPRRLLILVGALFVVSQVWSLLNSMVRYSTGTGSLMSTFLLHSKWSPPGGNALWLFACALGVCALVAVILVESRRQESDHTTFV